MDSADFNSESSIRLLDIVYDLHGSDKGYPYQNLPFSIGDDGAVSLSGNLIAELSKDANRNLMAWAKSNITHLF